MRDKEALKITAYHEAGHALVVYHSKEFHPLFKATIVANSHQWGRTSWLPKKELSFETKGRLLAFIDTCLGGRVAEEILLGKDQVTTGNLYQSYHNYWGAIM